MIIKGFVLLLLMVAAPIGTGLLINNVMPIKQRGVGNTYLCGFLCLLALFQLIAVPIVFLDEWGFSLIVILYTCLITILSGGGIIDALHCFRMEKTIWRKKGAYTWSKTLIIQWSIVGILILFQLFMAVFTASFDGDDAYYVVNSLITQETDTLYRILPYTGLSTSLDMRHAMAVFPIWIAYIARMTGIHATILSHTILNLLPDREEALHGKKRDASRVYDTGLRTSPFWEYLHLYQCHLFDHEKLAGKIYAGKCGNSCSFPCVIVDF